MTINRCYLLGALVTTCIIILSCIFICTNYYSSESFELNTNQNHLEHHHDHRRLGESAAVASDTVDGVPNPFMSTFCADLIADPQIIINVKYFSIVMVVRNEKKSGVLKSVSVDCLMWQ